MSEASSKLVEIGVVLQGGGALGAYECGAMNALLELMDEFAAHGRSIVLKAVSGVSIGAINAACVVGANTHADARARLNALWDDLTLEAPPFWTRGGAARPRLVRVAGLLRAAAGFLDRSDLDLCLRYASAARDARTPRRFRGAQRQRDRVRGDRGRCGNRDAATVRQQAARTREPRRRSSRATYWRAAACRRNFPGPRSTACRYWDGGIVDNTPLGEAIDAFSADPAVDRMLVVMNLYPLPRQASAQPGRGRGSHARAELRQSPAPGSRYGSARSTSWWRPSTICRRSYPADCR